MRLPRVVAKTHHFRFNPAGSMIRCSAFDASMDTALVKVGCELIKFSLKIIRIPVKDMVQILASDGSNEPFHKGMRYRNMWQGSHGINLKNSQVDLPLKEVKERVVVETETLGSSMSGRGLIEQSAECGSIDGDSLDSKPDDASRILVHHHQNPMSFQGDRLSAKQIDAPETILGVT